MLARDERRWNDAVISLQKTAKTANPIELHPIGETGK
jgi:hypothetical protein